MLHWYTPVELLSYVYEVLSVIFREIEKPVAVKPARNIYKLLAIIFIALTAVAFLVVILLAVYYTLRVDFTKEGVEKAFRNCDECQSCLTCLSPRG